MVSCGFLSFCVVECILRGFTWFCAGSAWFCLVLCDFAYFCMVSLVLCGFAQFGAVSRGYVWFRVVLCGFDCFMWFVVFCTFWHNFAWFVLHLKIMFCVLSYYLWVVECAGVSLGGTEACWGRDSLLFAPKKKIDKKVL